jgi:hypothetical protein
MITNRSAGSPVTATRVPAWAALCLATLLAACGGGGGASTGPASTPPPSGGGGGSTITYPLAVDPQPLRAVATSDDARATTQDVGIAGGTLSATAADGTQFTLTIPADALTYRARLRMTPLAALQIADLGAERSFGVKLEPEGQTFFKPVTLAITPPAGVSAPVGEQIAVGWSGANHTVSLAALDPKSSEVRLKLMHFSGYALLFAKKGVTASLAAVRHRLGGAAEERIASAMAERLGLERQKALLGIDGEGFNLAALEDLRTQYVNEVLKPRLAAAGSSCAASRLAMQTLLGYERQNALLGLENDPRYPKPFNTMVMEMLEQGALVCMKEEYEICRDEHIITRILPVFLGIARQMALLGTDPAAPGAPAWLAQAEDRVRQCLKFELQFDSNVQYSSSGMPTHSMSERVESRVKVGYRMFFTEPPEGSPRPITDTQALILGDFAPLVARDYHVAIGEDCASLNSSTAIGGRLGVGMMGFIPLDTWTARPVIADFALSIAAEMNRSTFNYTQRHRDAQNNCADPSTSDVMENWSTQGYSLIGDHFTSPDAGLNITGWTVTSGSDILATKDFTLRKTENGNSTTVTTQMVLFHTPER